MNKINTKLGNRVGQSIGTFRLRNYLSI